jgi:hypothetical protein
MCLSRGISSVFEAVNKYGGAPNVNECLCFDAHLQHTMAIPFGDHLLSDGIFQLEEEVVAIPGSDKQPNTDDEKVYSYDYSLGEQGIFSHDDESAISSDEDDNKSEDRNPKRPASVGKTQQSDLQSQPAPTELSLDALDNEAPHLPLNGVWGQQQNIRLL